MADSKDIRPSVVYVDEQEDERKNFLQDAILTDLFSSVEIVTPKAELSDTVAEILDLDVDALVTDFNLTDGAVLNYSGDDIVEAVRLARHDFPCFIRTSFEQDAIKESADVNMVYAKEEEKKPSGVSFFSRIAQQIEHYANATELFQAEFQKLRERDPKELTAQDEARLVELDTLLESRAEKRGSIAPQAKMELLKRQGELLSRSDALIAKLNEVLGKK